MLNMYNSILFLGGFCEITWQMRHLIKDANGKYNPQEIEKKWRNTLTTSFQNRRSTRLTQVLRIGYVPVPERDGLHAAIPSYTPNDIIARYKRMRGFNVLHPMGWDAFGLPAERHAVRPGEHPAVVTNRNCDNFKRQIQSLGLSYDWDREINTTDPKYYKWTQWTFQVLFERGLAYQAEAPVNWCPALGTVLANEEVKDGRYGQRATHKSAVLETWMPGYRILGTLVNDLDELDWPRHQIMHARMDRAQRRRDGVFKVVVPESSLPYSPHGRTRFSARPIACWPLNTP